MITGTDYPALLSTSHTECWAGQWEDWSRLSTVGFVKVDNINQVQHQHCIITPQTDTAPGHAGAFSASTEIMSDVWEEQKQLQSVPHSIPQFSVSGLTNWAEGLKARSHQGTKLALWVWSEVVSQETSKCITICYPGATLTPSIKQMDQHRPTQAALASPPDPPHYTQ